MRALLMAACVLGCNTTTPEAHYYALPAVTAVAGPAATATATLAVETFDVDRPYDDDRMVYRTTPYRLDYYAYDEWSAPPGELVAGFFAEAASHSGRFRAVVRDGGTTATVTLAGRIVALEEIDQNGTLGVAHVAIELVARDRASHPIWRQRFDEREPMATRDADGLARAAATVMQRIASTALPIVADLAAREPGPTVSRD